MPRNVWVLSLTAFLVAVGFGVIVPVLPVFARSFGVSQFAVGAVVSAFALMRFVTAPFCGRIARLIGERWMLGTGIGIVAVSSAVTGAAQSYWQMLVVRGLGGIGSAMFSVAAMVILLASVDAEHRGRASALYSGGFLLGSMAGPALGGLLAAISIRAPFFFYAGTLAVAGVAALVLLQIRTQDAGSARRSTTMSAREAWSQARYRVASWANFASGWQAQGARSTLVPLLVVEVLNRDTAASGTAFAIAAAVQTLALQPAGRLVDSLGRKPVLIGGLLICGVTSAAIPAAPSMTVLTVLLSLFGIGAAALSTAPTAIVGDVAPGGSPVAVFQMFADLGSIVGPLAVGWMADVWSLSTAFAIGAGLMGLVALIALLRPIDGLPAAEDKLSAPQEDQ